MTNRGGRPRKHTEPLTDLRVRLPESVHAAAKAAAADAGLSLNDYVINSIKERTVTTTTSYGTYANAVPGSSATDLRGAVLDAFGPDGYDGYDFDAIVAAMDARIDEVLDGTGITIHGGSEFYGPYQPTAEQRAAMDALIERVDPSMDGIRDGEDPTVTQAAVALAWAETDFWALVEQHATA